MRNILIVAGGAVAVVAIAAGVWFGTRPTAPSVRRSPRRPCLPMPSRCSRSSRSDHVHGRPNAPITLIEYASLTCPHCADFNITVLPELEKKWVETGKVKLIYRDFPLDQVATKAAQLAECAGNDRYFARDRHDVPRPGHVGCGAGSDRRAFQVAAHRRHGRDRGQGLPGQRGGRQRRDRRLSRRRDAGGQFDADRSSSTASSSRERARSRNSTPCSASSRSNKNNKRGVKRSSSTSSGSPASSPSSIRPNSPSNPA